MTPELRALVLRRAGGKCEECGGSIAELEATLAATLERVRNKPGPAAMKALAGVHRAMKQHGYSPHCRVWEVDHIIPLSEGGPDDLSNLRALCYPCHKEWTRGLQKRRKRKGKMR